MNPELNCIFNRRSVRKYSARAVTERTVRDLLEAAMSAPSACCTDPWEFIVITEKDLLTEIADGLPYGKMLPHAQVGVVVCGDMDRAHGGEISYMLQDCSAAIENLLLAADILGLGTCWLGVHPRAERITHIRGLFDLPDNIVPIAALAVGYPAEHPGARTRYNERMVHKNVW